MIVAASNTSTSWADHAFWLASRACGVVAIAMLTFTVIVGLMQGGRMPLGFKARDLTRIHEFSSLAAIVAIVAHGVLLLADPWLAPTVAQIAVPFQLEYRPVYTGLGITAGWIAVLLGLSYYIRDQIGIKRWKTLHRFTIIAYALSVVHVLGAGTDSGETWLKAPLLASTGVVAVLFAVRIACGRRLHSREPATSFT
ncbi:MAG: ferric reductase-like transmembrane domain-containing protein [Thermoleophilaceae bacterium]|nr:ferric reductase-like transmembrane domain-containing protein [Thermoleophilaceae bacterium]